MKIETRFNVGDEVYMLHDNRVVCKIVKTISTFIHGGTSEPILKYGFETCNGRIEKYESEVFDTKEKLLKSL